MPVKRHGIAFVLALAVWASAFGILWLCVGGQPRLHLTMTSPSWMMGVTDDRQYLITIPQWIARPGQNLACWDLQTGTNTEAYIPGLGHANIAPHGHAVAC